jgi:uncharacterized protein (TIRG00374 family)
VITGRNAVLVAGAAIVVVLLASVAIARRDTWFQALKRHRRLVELVVLGAVIAVAAALLVAHHDELEGLLERIENGDPLWLAIAAACEIASFAGYVVLVRIIHSPLAPRLDVPASIELTLAGVVATRLLSAGGAGGIAFTAWVLHRAGMGARDTARRLAAFMALLYSVYMGSLVVGGLLVVTGALGGVPTVLGVVALAVGSVVVGAFGLMLLIPGDLERRVEAMSKQSGRRGRIATRLATVPQIAGNATRLVLRILRTNPTMIVWPLVWWAFDVATLWATFNAFGDAPATGTLILCYFLGQLGNLLPLPGGVGGAEGGMVGAFAASGVDAGLALLAVVSYQLISTYLPALPGLGAYLDLRRRMRHWDPDPEPAAA